MKIRKSPSLNVGAVVAGQTTSAEAASSVAAISLAPNNGVGLSASSHQLSAARSQPSSPSRLATSPLPSAAAAAAVTSAATTTVTTRHRSVSAAVPENNDEGYGGSGGMAASSSSAAAAAAAEATAAAVNMKRGSFTQVKKGLTICTEWGGVSRTSYRSPSKIK